MLVVCLCAPNNVANDVVIYTMFLLAACLHQTSGHTVGHIIGAGGLSAGHQFQLSSDISVTKVHG
jgi:hypothetical protein